MYCHGRFPPAATRRSTQRCAPDSAGRSGSRSPAAARFRGECAAARARSFQVPATPAARLTGRSTQNLLRAQVYYSPSPLKSNRKKKKYCSEGNVTAGGDAFLGTPHSSEVHFF